MAKSNFILDRWLASAFSFSIVFFRISFISSTDVNLRCMNILPGSFVLYAGGGILASSEIESEWLETEAKMQTMKRLINSIDKS